LRIQGSQGSGHGFKAKTFETQRVSDVYLAAATFPSHKLAHTASAAKDPSAGCAVMARRMSAKVAEEADCHEAGSSIVSTNLIASAALGASKKKEI